MAKLTVGSTEVIDDNGLIDWEKLTNNPAAASVAQIQYGSASNCGTDCWLSVVIGGSDGTTAITFNMVSGSNCNCNCQCSVNCNC